MATSVNNTSSASYTNTSRISGLASGIDTDALVESMTANTLSKIYKAEQNKQLLEWKQEQYREISTMMTDFYNKYFNTANPSYNITSSSFFNTISATSSSPYISIATSSNSSVGSIMVKDIVSVATASTLTSGSGASIPSTISIDTTKLDSLSGKSMTVTINGQTKVITFANKTYKDTEDVRAELSRLIDNAFGLNTVSITANDNTITVDNSGGTIVLGNAGEDKITDILGFKDGQSNRLSLTSSISSLGITTDSSFKFSINGVEFEFDSSASLNQVMSKINSSNAGVKMSYSSITDKFTLTADETGSGANISFTDTEGSLMSTLFGGSGVFTEGKNAEILVSVDNGLSYQSVVRRSNTFDVNGVTLNILGKAEGSVEENVVINVTRDTEAVINKIKQFTEEYNKLITTLRTKLNEKKDRNYPPLTEAQKEEMTEEQISKWEAKAKVGLLGGDTALQSAYTSLRSVFITDIKDLDDNNQSIGININNIGITTGSYLSGEYGTLKIDEAALREALNNTPEKVVQLFTQQSDKAYESEVSEQKVERNNENGLAWRISDILKNNIRTTRDSQGRKGTLLELAGKANDTTELTNTLYKRISNINSSIAKLKEMLEKERERYYSQFTSMEQSLSKLNAMASYFLNSNS